MTRLSLTRLRVEDGNVRLVDLTRRGVRVQVSPGVVREAELNRWFSRHLARGLWRDATTAERGALDCPAAEASPSQVYVLDIPARLAEAFWAGPANAIASASSDASRKLALDGFRETLLETLADLPGFEVRSTRTFDIMIGPPGAPSTSFDARSGEFVGLHLDDHEGLDFEGRSQGFQLLSVNLGRAPRYFQFVNRDAADILERVGGMPALPAEAQSAASLVQTFFGMFPDCPVLRLVLEPCQAYVAVTQDLIHDGATNDRGRPDIHCLLGGRFEPVGRGA